MQEAESEGLKVLGDVIKKAVLRLLRNPEVQLSDIPNPLNDSDLEAVANLTSSVRATSELLGRQRIRELAFESIDRNVGLRVASESASITIFQDGDEIPLMAPERALEFFKNLTPSLDRFPNFVEQTRRTNFTLAKNVDLTVRTRVQNSISDFLKRGESRRGMIESVNEILDRAGVTDRNPQYAEMVVRTNFIDAIQQGMEEEMQDPDVSDTFPVWRYSTVGDNRVGDDHKPLDNTIWPSEKKFRAVRGPRAFNCRCVPIPIDKWEWARLNSQGARLQEGQKPPVVAVGKGLDQENEQFRAAFSSVKPDAGSLDHEQFIAAGRVARLEWEERADKFKASIIGQIDSLDQEMIELIEESVDANIDVDPARIGAISRQIQRLEGKLVEASNNAAAQVVEAIRPIGGLSVSLSSQTSKNAAVRFNAGLASTPRSWIEKANDVGLPLTVKATRGRGKFSPGLAQAGRPRIDISSNPGVEVHEFMHYMEFLDNNLVEIEERFYRQFFAGESAIRYDEAWRRLDGLDLKDVYFGKVYSQDGDFTSPHYEIVTTGIQDILFKGSSSVEKYPDLQDFLWGILTAWSPE